MRGWLSTVGVTRDLLCWKDNMNWKTLSWCDSPDLVDWYPVLSSVFSVKTGRISTAFVTLE